MRTGSISSKVWNTYSPNVFSIYLENGRPISVRLIRIRYVPLSNALIREHITTYYYWATWMILFLYINFTAMTNHITAIADLSNSRGSTVDFTGNPIRRHKARVLGYACTEQLQGFFACEHNCICLFMFRSLVFRLNICSVEFPGSVWE